MDPLMIVLLFLIALLLLMMLAGMASILGFIAWQFRPKRRVLPQLQAPVPRAPVSQPAAPQQVAQQAQVMDGVSRMLEYRQASFTPVIVLDDGPDKVFYAILVVAPPDHIPTQRMRAGFVAAVQGNANYRIVSERVALEMLGLRYGGYVCVSELNVQKVIF